MAQPVQPLMPKATAEWLIENTMLTFDQIADFCGLHKLEIQALADGEINTGIMPASPIASGELTKEEIERCEGNTRAKLKMCKSDLPKPKARAKGPRYTPVAKRAEKPNAALFLIKNYPHLADIQIAKLVGSTKPTVESIRNRTHTNMTNLKPTDPVLIGLCKQMDLDKQLGRADRRLEREAKAKAKEAKAAATQEAETGATSTAPEAPVTAEEPTPNAQESSAAV